MKQNRHYIALALLLALVFSLSGCGSTKAEESSATEAAAPQQTVEKSPESEAEVEAEAAPAVEEEPEAEPFEVTVQEFNKRGNVILNATFEEMNEKNMEPADIISVTIGDETYEFPVGTSYSDVDSGNMLCRFDTEDAKVMLVINGGSFAETTGMAVKETITEDPGYRWNVNIDTVSLVLKEKGGYKDEYTVRNLERSNERADYSTLSDADYANCRFISTTGISSGILSRGTTPLDPDIGRDTYAMAFISENGVKSVLNLADSVDEMTAFESYPDSYYASCSIWNAEMDYSFTSESFGEKIRGCVEFINANEGPYYIHCKEGKDRTGILCAILECYLGASYEEVKQDYMQTYINFYAVEDGSETYDTILRTNINKTLCNMFDISDPATADLQAEAEEYLLSTGLTADELAALTAKLAA